MSIRRAIRTEALGVLAAIAAWSSVSGGPMALQVKTNSFLAGAAIPKQYTCDGSDVSPGLSWSGAPAGTRELALICDDPDAPGGTFTHWLMWAIPASQRAIAEGRTPPEARQGQNGFGVSGYRGPCPPRGKPHRYYFRVFALDTSVSLSAGASRADLEAAMSGHVLARGEVMGTYGR
jgi:Raf kinase inhibitor-like YbhB/YbcL family protein